MRWVVDASKKEAELKGKVVYIFRRQKKHVYEAKR